MTRKGGPKSISSLLDGLPGRPPENDTTGAPAPVSNGDLFPQSDEPQAPAASADLPAHTLRDAKLIAARRIRQQKADAGQEDPDKGGSAISKAEVDFIEPEQRDLVAATRKNADEDWHAEMSELEIQRRLAIEERKAIADGEPNAAMKGVMAAAVRDGVGWDPLHVNDDWIHLPHDFFDSGLIKVINDRAFKVLMAIKRFTNKQTGVAVVNKTKMAEYLGVQEKTIQRAISDLVKLEFIKKLDSDAPVKGHGVRYQVIERLRMVNAMPVPPERETIVDAAFPYAGKNFQTVSKAARNFASSGVIPSAEVMHLTPLKSPYLHEVLNPGPLPSIVPVVQEKNVVVQNITVNVSGSVNAPINIHTAGIVKKGVEPTSDDVNLPDGRGNPLKSAMKVVRRKDDGVFEVDD